MAFYERNQSENSHSDTLYFLTGYITSKEEEYAMALNDKKASIPVDDFNHSIDAGRYAFERLLLGKKTGVRRRN